MSLVLPKPPMRPLAGGLALVLLLLLCGAWVTLRSYGDLHRMVRAELELRFLSGQLLYYRGQLSLSARLAVETGDLQWEASYRRAYPLFHEALRRMVTLAPQAAVMKSPTWAASAALLAAENDALILLGEGERDAARALLVEPGYAQLQTGYVQGLATMAADSLAEGEARLAMQRREVVAAALLGLAVLAALCAAWLWIARLVHQYLLAAQTAERALSEVNRDLERRVDARTAELTQANQQLRREMERRTKMELELRQAQKLEAVGRLAAGVAHEINTPVQFVNDSCHFLHDGLQQTMEQFCRYREALVAATGGQLTADQARALLARDDEEQAYFTAHMPEASARALEGLERIAGIVRSMKEFSHPGSRDRGAIDLNAAIRSTLTIARGEYKYVADVHTEFGEIPPLDCYPADLNQAILNLVVNAAQAIADAVRGSDRRGRITLRTRIEEGETVIEIEDDGCGIPEAIRDRIFDPFFTTKEVGRGSGQGLAITHAIVVEKHRGRIDVASEAGRGSCFTIHLPQTAPGDAPLVRAA